MGERTTHVILNRGVTSLDYPIILQTRGNSRQQCGRYELLGRLATGGMAEVFLGRVLGPQSFERPVAVKRILPHLARDPRFVDMFVREAQIAARIRHARVAQVHELATIDGDYAMVMEYVDGESLGGLMRRLWLRGEPFDRTLAAHIVAEASAGLHAAHELTDGSGGVHGVVHRDVSPQNIMVTYAGEVKILDFGIAKAIDSADTQNGQLKGKCEYMSPEQCRGEPLDRRSDIFSLGTVLYELTVGKRLFKRDSATLALHAVCHEPIPRPTEVDPGYPQILEAICARALVRDRRERYATALAMRRDLVAAIRRMSATGGGEDEALAVLMSRLFADRIAEKRSMLRQARTGAEVECIPVAEVDTEVEEPEVPRALHAGIEGTRSRRSGRHRLTRHRAALAGAAVIAVALGGAHCWRSGDATGSDPPATVVVTPVRATLPSPVEAPPRVERPVKVSLAVESKPPGAGVFLGGELHGHAPCSIELVRSDEPIAVAVSRDGFQPVVEHVVPNGDQRLVVHLRPSTANTRKSPGARSMSPKHEAPAVFERFE
jgi:hypothetical protein